MTDKPEIGQLIETMLNMPGYHIYMRVRSMETNWLIFRDNYAEFKKLAKSLKEKPIIDQLVGVTAQKKELREVFMRECARLSANFLASSMNLVEYTRNIITQNYSGSEIFSKYQTYINSNIKSNQSCRMIQDLRNYSSHFNILPITLVFSIPQEFPYEFKLLRDDLLKFKKMKKSEYLLHHQGDISIEELFDDYYHTVFLLNEWLLNEMQDLYSEELEAYFIIQGKVNEFHENIGK